MVVEEKEWKIVKRTNRRNDGRKKKIKQWEDEERKAGRKKERLSGW